MGAGADRQGEAGPAGGVRAGDAGACAQGGPGAVSAHTEDLCGEPGGADRGRGAGYGTARARGGPCAAPGLLGVSHGGGALAGAT